ncbi:MAG: LysR family transcriptional regulator [Pikeienuella sp.]
MLSTENLKAFALAAELGSFSAAARQLGKAQSAVSTAIANLEIDAGVTLFDRSGHKPELTAEGRALLPFADGVLLGVREFGAKATSLSEGVEDKLVFAVEEGVNLNPVVDQFLEFSERFPHVALDILEPGLNDTADLLKSGRADLGLMIEREHYPVGFQFRGVGHSLIASFCHPDHPLAALDVVSFKELRQHRQLEMQSVNTPELRPKGAKKTALVWHVESPYLMVDMLLRGLGWAELPLHVASDHVAEGRLKRLNYSFQQSDMLEGVDVVWTEHNIMGTAGRWLRDQFLNLPQQVWRGD